MEKIYNSKTSSKVSYNAAAYFRISYEELSGAVLHGMVRQVSTNLFEVFVEEKEVIIQCVRSTSGRVSCNLNFNRNPGWVNGISAELERTLNNNPFYLS